MEKRPPAAPRRLSMRLVPLRGEQHELDHAELRRRLEALEEIAADVRVVKRLLQGIVTLGPLLSAIVVAIDRLL